MTTLIAGDVGGTKARLALYSINQQELKKERTERYESAKYGSFHEIAQHFLKDVTDHPIAACIGIPGPVMNGTVKVTNLPWTLSEKELSETLNIPKFKLVNDLVATAAAVPYFATDEILTLYPGKKLGAEETAAVVAPGTGLGQAFLQMRGGRVEIFPSEGGHANFAPHNDLQLELYRYLRRDSEHVSVEHVLCGPGLSNIYNFLKDSGKFGEPEELINEMKNGVPAAVISQNALQNKYDICVKTLDIFVDILGAHCSNLLLTVLAGGGIYLGGGIPPKIIDKLTDGSILESYFAKGKMRKQVEGTALYVIKDDLAALHGAARLAFQL